ncbi:hypothetical protein [Thalassospira sp. MCCC 1A01428]|uniref:hypothetical protein n=1 Tax=Thalassospira sp. MCCC 1A01428 TaxID=1470575 RepID=UPI000A200028|nr:hypothetical protein [Thalassospira sp. MCCC 1A01428]OSQ41693.1 hypothetical protein THS27_17685 [Thalassospira sp. MCCC 1A01428]
MAKNNHAKALPVLDPALGERIRHVVEMFDRKKDAAEVAGVIPEQLNRWCHAQSEPRFVGIARLASAQSVRLEWIVTGHGPVHTDPVMETTGSPQNTRARRGAHQHVGNLDQSNVHHMGVSEIVGATMANGDANNSAEEKSLPSAKATAINKDQANTAKSLSPNRPYDDLGLLSAIVTGFLTAEGIDDAPRITQDILAAYKEITTLLGDELSQADTGMMIAQIVSAIIRRHSISNRKTPTDTP